MAQQDWTIPSLNSSHIGIYEQQEIRLKFFPSLDQTTFNSLVNQYTSLVDQIYEDAKQNPTHINARLLPKSLLFGETKSVDKVQKILWYAPGIYCLVRFIHHQLMGSTQYAQAFRQSDEMLNTMDAVNLWLCNLGTDFTKILHITHELLVFLGLPMHRPLITNNLTKLSTATYVKLLKKYFVGIDSQLEHVVQIIKSYMMIRKAAFRKRLKLLEQQRNNMRSFSPQGGLFIEGDSIELSIQHPTVGLMLLSGVPSGKTTIIDIICHINGITGTPALIQIDGASLSSEASSSTLTGSSHGLVDGKLGCLADRLVLLMEFCHNNPDILPIVVIDNIHMAHECNINILCELFCSGYLPAYHHPSGYITVDNVLFICTSNWGQEEMVKQYKKIYGHNLSSSQLSQVFTNLVMDDMIADGWNPSTIGRIAQIVPFPPMSDANLQTLIQHSTLEIIKQTCENHGVKNVQIGSTAIDHYSAYARCWYNPCTGVRVIIDSIENVIGGLISSIDIDDMDQHNISVQIRCHFDAPTRHMYVGLHWCTHSGENGVHLKETYNRTFRKGYHLYQTLLK